MTKDNFTLRGPNGAELHLEEIKSLRGVRLLGSTDVDNFFEVDVVTTGDLHLKDYTCSFDCLNLICAMLYSESEAEDKTLITFSFEALVNALMLSKNSKSEDLGSLKISDEEMEEFFNRDTNALLN
jgi:hypothetical protein